MGLNKPSNRNYINVSYGALRKKCEETHPDAVKREKKDGSFVFEQVWRSVDGILKDVIFKPDNEYGNKWNVILYDGTEEFGIQIQEDSRYGADFLRKLPNLKRGENYTITPYDFEHNGEHRIGISIVDQSGNKVQSYYQKFTGDGKETKVENINGFPNYDGDWKDKDEVQIYFKRITKFLRNAGIEFLKSGFSTHFVEQEPQTAEPPEKDDLPF
jgi:hypothetical protein